jgi:Raf kinase inhibitor-like YbhB/YbcL family protein
VGRGKSPCPVSRSMRYNAAMDILLTSPAFAEGDPIPALYTADGADLSPPLQWQGAPPHTRSWALFCTDPDAPAGLWTHWVVFNLPAETQGLPQRLARVYQLADGTRQGLNSFRKLGWNGPDPPPGPVHRYQFHLYALDIALKLVSGAPRPQVLRAMEGHILAQATLTGHYQRAR